MHHLSHHPTFLFPSKLLDIIVIICFALSFCTGLLLMDEARTRARAKQLPRIPPIVEPSIKTVMRSILCIVVVSI
jgi:hypothetical protein